MSNDRSREAEGVLRDLEKFAETFSDETTPGLAHALRRVMRCLEDLKGVEARLAAQQGLLDERLLRVEHNRLFTSWNAITRTALRLWRRSVRERDTYAQTSEPGYDIWVAHEQAGLPAPDDAHASMSTWKYRPLFSFLVPPSVAPDAWRRFFSSVHTQVYPAWEACIAVNGDTSSLPVEAQSRYIPVEPGMPDAQALNVAAHAASGEYLVFVDPFAGFLAQFALYYAAEALQHDRPDLLYTDEDRIGEADRRVRPVFKPAWSPDLLRVCMYMGSFVIVARERFLDMGGLRSDAGAAVLHDFALRMIGKRPTVHHIPRVLYHARRKSLCGPSQPAVEAASAAPEVTVVICSRTPELLRKCLTSVRATGGETLKKIIVVAHEEAGPNPQLRTTAADASAEIVPFFGTFNFAAMNNIAAARATTPAILFLNDDLQATRPGWLFEISAHLLRPETGIAGATLWYPDDGLQHAGIVAGIWDGVGHAGRGLTESSLWPWLPMTRNVSAVTGACLAIRTELFRELGGFDTAFANNYNDVDICFRARAHGYEVICVSTPGLIHAECRTRRGIVRFEERYRFHKRWQHLLSQPDPYYSVSLAPTERIALNLSRDSGVRGLLAGNFG